MSLRTRKATRTRPFGSNTDVELSPVAESISVEMDIG
jgi:hypothetical protein